MADDFFEVPGNHVRDIAQLPAPASLTSMYKMKSPLSLENLAIEAYLKYLEGEVVAYINLTQTESALLRGVAIRMMATLKDQLNGRMSGIASSAIRQKMLKIILSDRFPSPQYCNIYIKRGRKTNEIEAHRQHIAIAAAVAAVGIQPAAIAVAANIPPNNQELDVLPPIVDAHLPVAQAAALGLGVAGEANIANPLMPNTEDNLHEDLEQVYSNCPNTCCTGAFIQEAMAGVIMSADIRELIFTSEQVTSRRSSTFSCLEFNIPVVLTHLLSATHQHFSQLERLIFSENFVKEDSSISSLSEEEASSRLRLLQHQDPIAVLEHQYRRQDRFARHFAAVTTQAANGSHNSVYCSADRKGLALGLLVMFRDVAPRSPLTGDLIGFYKLTEIVLKNNVQCELYSKANFQFELLARIGFCCPRLKVLDLFGTDTWADCLVAFFFRDAFHSLHRYLFFMENEEDEDSAYHPHDLSRYCQFCLDRLHPVAVERPFTINPVIPLIDPIYDHVIKKYPKRSYCILRNCVKVSDLIQCPKSTVYELLRPTVSQISTNIANKTVGPTCSTSSSDVISHASGHQTSQTPADLMAISGNRCRNETARSDLSDGGHEDNDYSIEDDVATAEDTSRFCNHEPDTIRSRLRSATKSTSMNKNNRSRRHLKGTRQNQDPRVVLQAKADFPSVGSSKEEVNNPLKHLKCQHNEKSSRNVHKNWKKRCLRNSEDFVCQCSNFKDNASKGSIKLNKGEENPLSRIMNEDGTITILSEDKPVKTYAISCNRRRRENWSSLDTLDFSNKGSPLCSKNSAEAQTSRRRRSTRLIAKTLKRPGSTPEKHQFQKRKADSKAFVKKLCDQCANQSSYNTRHSKSRNKFNSQNTNVGKTNSYDSAESSYFENSSFCEANQSCSKYSSPNCIKSKGAENRKTSNPITERSCIQQNLPSKINCKVPFKNINENLCSDDIVMTRAMRKRKIGWTKQGRTHNRPINETELSDNATHVIECSLGHDGEDVNCVEEAKRLRKSPKSEICHFGSVEVDAGSESTYESFSKSNDKDNLFNSSQNLLEVMKRSQSEIKTISFEEWQKEASNKWATYTSTECDCNPWQHGASWSHTNDNNQKSGTSCSQERYNTSHNTKNTHTSTVTKKESKDKVTHNPPDPTINFAAPSLETEWTEPKNVRYREISGWPHLNDCIQTLELLNIGGTNVLGEFIPFILLYAPHLKSLGQWINTMIYGLEILRQLPGQSKTKFAHIEEFSYSTDRNYFCQPYIGFVPESNEYRNVRKEMVRQSAKVAKRLGHSVRNHAAKRQQIEEDVKLMVDACPNVHKLNLVLHHKLPVLDEADVIRPWSQLTTWTRLRELDLVTMRFSNVRTLLKVVGPQLLNLTLEMDDEQGSGSEIVHIARHCPELRSLRLLIGDKILRGEMTLHFGTQFFRHLERLTVEGSVHLHGFAFLWGHCRNLTYLRIGNVVSNEVTTTNVLIYDVFTLLFQVNKMEHLEEMHIKNLKIRSLQMGQFLLENLPRLKKASNWLLDIYGQDLADMKRLIFSLKRSKALMLEFREW